MVQTILGYLSFLPLLILLQIVAYHRYQKKQITVPARHMVWSSLFFFYLILVLLVTGPGDIMDFGRLLIRPDEINLIPLRWGSVFGLTANLLLFVPLGFFLRLLWNRSVSNTALTGFAFSLLIEISQLFNRRSTDIDDLLTNTLGAVLGCMLCMFVVKNNKKYRPSPPGFKDAFLKNLDKIGILTVFLIYFAVKPLFSIL